MTARSFRPSIRIGIGGWVYEPWRRNFYPNRMGQTFELQFASRKLTSIEINGTFYGLLKPKSFVHWHNETPDDFVFGVKGPRAATHRHVLAEAGLSIERFFASGVLELKAKLGPIDWQFADTKQFDAADFEAFLQLLPKTLDGRAIRHAVEVRHASFRVPEFVALARAYGVAVVVLGDSEYPQIADVTAPFVYVRIMGTKPDERHGYPEAALEQWVARTRAWAAGGVPEDLPCLAAPAPKQPRDVFLYVIDGHKIKNPAVAMRLIEMVG